VVRNPLDLAVSFAHHFQITLQEALNNLAFEEMALSANGAELAIHLKQRLLSWGSHVSSWLDQHPIPLHLMRYEDMLFRPLDTFSAAVRFLGWEEDIERIRRAVAFSSFDTLRQQEQSHGFRERIAAERIFFREGRSDIWRDLMTGKQQEQALRDHGAVMQRLGYLSRSGDVVPPGLSYKACPATEK
jgi:hypothetical protein